MLSVTVMGPIGGGVRYFCHGTHWWCCSLLLSWDPLVVVFVNFVMGPIGGFRNCRGTHWWCCSLLLSWDPLVMFVTFVMRHMGLIRGVVRYVCHGPIGRSG